MENNKDKKIAPENPKPTDDVQMEIETVVPSTHEDSVKGANLDDETKQPEAKEETEVPPTAEDSAENEIKDNETNPAEEKNPKDDPDDRRNDIETISPSA